MRILNRYFLNVLKNANGVTIVFVALSMGLLLGFAALGVDVGYQYMAHNELQNAADAGALAGARELYLDDGTAVNDGTYGEPSANQVAYDAATANESVKTAVEVNWTSGQNIGSDVERGHWSFGLGNLARGFYPSDDSLTLQPVGQFDRRILDGEISMISSTPSGSEQEEVKPLHSFFARIFGYQDFNRTAEAVAYWAMPENSTQRRLISLLPSVNKVLYRRQVLLQCWDFYKQRAG